MPAPSQTKDLTYQKTSYNKRDVLTRENLATIVIMLEELWHQKML